MMKMKSKRTKAHRKHHSMLDALWSEIVSYGFPAQTANATKMRAMPLRAGWPLRLVALAMMSMLAALPPRSDAASPHVACKLHAL